MLWRLGPWNKWRKSKYLRDNDSPKLQLGCGKNILDGWLNTDISLYCLLGVYLDASKRFPFKDGTFEYVFSEHVFEHLTYSQAMNMLQESYRVLKPGGVIRIATPDLRFLMGLYQDPEKPLHKSYIEWYAKGAGLPAEAVYVISHFHTGHGHQIIYDRDALARLLKQVGFKNICPCEVGESAHPALIGVEAHFKTSLGVEFNKLETMVLEATK